MDTKAIVAIAGGVALLGGIAYLAMRDDGPDYVLPLGVVDFSAPNVLAQTQNERGQVTVYLAPSVATHIDHTPIDTAGVIAGTQELSEAQDLATRADLLQFFNETFKDIVEGRVLVQHGVKLAAMEDPTSGLRGLTLSYAERPESYTRYMVAADGSQESQTNQSGELEAMDDLDTLSTTLLTITSALRPLETSQEPAVDETATA